jgi:NAD(P)-dependent dehydrogenase (short-subunit alcohol dehydrogenase family)
MSFATVVGAVAAVALLLLLLRRWLQGPRCRSTARLHQKTVVITGANAGIGKLTALDLARRGAQVVLLCRSPARAQQAAEEIRAALKDCAGAGEILTEELDLSSLESVRACAQRLTDRLDRIDILVNNAGVMVCPLTRTADGFELQFGTNHLGHFLLTHLLLPLLERSGNARVVTVSSMAHQSGKIQWEDPNYERTAYSPLAAYAQSKLANLLFSAELGRRAADRGITTYALHPGVIRTELDRHVSETYGLLVGLGYRYLIGPFIKSPEHGAQTTIYCCVEPSLAGTFYNKCRSIRRPQLGCAGFA